MTNEMERASVEITLAGKTYRIDEPVRRRARAMITTMGGVLRRMFEAQNEPNDVLKGMIMLGAVDAALDWLYGHFDDIRADKKHLDAEATETEIITAFNTVAEFIARPFPFQVTPKNNAAASPVTDTPKAESTS